MNWKINTIVLAEDDQDDVLFFKEAIDEVCPGVDLFVAPDGEQLLTLLNIIAIPDIIILDMNMPNMGGPAVVKKIREDQRFQHVPIVIFSASKNDVEINESLNNGGDYYMNKPGSYRDQVEFANAVCRGTFKERFKPW